MVFETRKQLSHELTFMRGYILFTIELAMAQGRLWRVSLIERSVNLFVVL